MDPFRPQIGFVFILSHTFQGSQKGPTEETQVLELTSAVLERCIHGMFFCLAAVLVPLASKHPTTCKTLDEIEANHARIIIDGGPIIMKTDATVGGDRKKIQRV